MTHKVQTGPDCGGEASNRCLGPDEDMVQRLRGKIDLGSRNLQGGRQRDHILEITADIKD